MSDWIHVNFRPLIEISVDVNLIRAGSELQQYRLKGSSFLLSLCRIRTHRERMIS